MHFARGMGRNPHFTFTTARTMPPDLQALLRALIRMVRYLLAASTAKISAGK
ncbi:MAG: hypothetical protein ABI304_02710 [Rudaea sp.]